MCRVGEVPYVSGVCPRRAGNAKLQSAVEARPKDIGPGAVSLVSTGTVPSPGLTNKPEGWAAADDVNDIGQLSDDMSRPARARRVATKI